MIVLRSRATSALALVVTLGLGGAVVGLGAAAPAGPAFAGPDRCADCHPDIHDAWSRSTHARTLMPANAGTLPPVMREAGRILHPPGESRFEREDDRVIAWTTGPDGREERYVVDGVLGARRVTMYLTTLPDGRRQVLPFMLDEPNGRFFDYTHLVFGAGGPDPNVPPAVRPGEPTFWTGATRDFDARCARCHTVGWRYTGFEVPPGAPRSEFHHPGVGCEGCHGPAAAHAEFQESGEGPEEPILSLGRLSPERRNDICLTCHTEADAVDPAFTLGDDFLEAFDPTLMDDGETLDPSGRPIELVYDGVPFLTSPCAREGGLTCLDCHDPHGSPYRGQLTAPAGSDDLCAGCHGEVVARAREHSRHDPRRDGGRCTDCHMPLLTVERGHGVVTDHTIGVPDPGFAGPGIATDACTWCHSGGRGAPGGVPRKTPGEILAAHRDWWPEGVRSRPWASVLRSGRQPGPGAAAALAGLARDASAPRVARAAAAALLGRHAGEALPALVRLAADEDSLVRRRAAFALGEVEDEEADSVLLKLLLDDSPAVRRRAARAALRGWTRPGRSPSLVEPLLAALTERTAAYPEDDEAWFLLGAARQLAGDAPGAARAYRKKLFLDPYASLVRRALESLSGR